METEDYEREFVRDRTIIEEERRVKMEIEWLEAEYYREQGQLPAKIITIKTLKEHENTTNG